MTKPFRDELLPYLLARASQALGEGFSGALKRRGLSVRQWRVLGSLWDVESLTLGELAEAILCEQSSTTRLVERLVAAGLVDKRVPRDDRRKVHVSLTAKGREVSAELVQLALSEERAVAADHGIARVAALKAELEALIERFAGPAEAEIGAPAPARRSLSNS
jgi:DNA-binding MarR family transcriptional regulator